MVRLPIVCLFSSISDVLVDEITIQAKPIEVAEVQERKFEEIVSVKVGGWAKEMGCNYPILGGC